MPIDPVLSAFERLLDTRPACAIVQAPSQCVDAAGLDALARRAAGVLMQGSCGPGRLIGLDAPNGPTLLAGYVALRRCGCAPLLLDHSAPIDDKRRAAAALGASGSLRACCAWGEQSDSFSFEATTDLVAAREMSRDVGAVKLTSGSSGAPRGVVATAAALAADEDQLWRSMQLHHNDKLLVSIPLTHSYGFSSLLLPALMRGATLVMADEPGPLTPLHAADVCGATYFPTVPAWLAALVKIGSPPPWPRSLRLVVAAGAVLPAAVAAHFRSAFGSPVHVFYGASECGGITYDRQGDAAEHGSVGTPVEGVSIQLDDEGIVSVLSAAVASGYIGDGSDRLQPGRFVSGDLAVWDQDRLVLRGRADDVINIKGKKFSPREVEAVIAEMPGVDDVAVLSVAGPNDVAVVRAVVATTLQELSYDAVVAWCRSRLAEHKVPRSVLLVPELPRTERGKLDRVALSS